MAPNHTLYPMNHKDIFGWIGSIVGTGGTIYLGSITSITSSVISAFFTVACGTATLVLTILKIVQWWYWWKNRSNSTKPPSI